jgi:alanine dehydrogenase
MRLAGDGVSVRPRLSSDRLIRLVIPVHIGIPKEIKVLEGRVALIPPAAGELVRHGHEVHVQAGAGDASGYPDSEYQALGVQIEVDAAALYAAAQLIVKVKEPIPAEYPLLRRDHVLFGYLHLAAVPELAARLTDIGLTAIGWETVAEDDGTLPLLVPMSDVAGRLAVHLGAQYLQRPNGGKGLMLGGLPATERGHVVVLGAGSVGGNAVRVAAAMGARVTVFARHRPSLERMHALGPNITALPSYPALLEQHVADADLLVGGVLVAGARAPVLVPESLVKRMRPGSVIVDVAVDQGGCVETIRPTTWEDPVYLQHGVVHFGVTNMPGAVPRTSAQALSTSVLPFVLRLAAEGGLEDAPLARGINVRGGEIVHPAVRAALE